MRTSKRSGERRLSYAQRQVLQLLAERQEISYNQMCAILGIDIHTAIQAVYRLEERRLITCIRTRGRVPNRYVVHERSEA